MQRAGVATLPINHTDREGGHRVLGPAKSRCLDEPIAVSLEKLVPRDHFYRHLEAKLDLGFVRDWARELYAERGRPSIDPVVFLKLQLVMFFEGIRSERQLIETANLKTARRRSTRPRSTLRRWLSSSASGRTDRSKRSKGPHCVCCSATSSRSPVSEVLRRRREVANQSEPPRKLSRQQLRAQAREKHNAEGWIAALDIQDLALQRAIRTAIGSRQVTRAELEADIGVSLVGTPRTIRGMRKS
jgi:hypothetical protein